MALSRSISRGSDVVLDSRGAFGSQWGVQSSASRIARPSLNSAGSHLDLARTRSPELKFAGGVGHFSNPVNGQDGLSAAAPFGASRTPRQSALRSPRPEIARSLGQRTVSQPSEKILSHIPGRSESPATTPARRTVSAKQMTGASMNQRLTPRRGNQGMFGRLTGSDQSRNQRSQPNEMEPEIPPSSPWSRAKESGRETYSPLSGSIEPNLARRCTPSKSTISRRSPSSRLLEPEKGKPALSKRSPQTKSSLSRRSPTPTQLEFRKGRIPTPGVSPPQLNASAERQLTQPKSKDDGQNMTAEGKLVKEEEDAPTIQNHAGNATGKATRLMRSPGRLMDSFNAKAPSIASKRQLGTGIPAPQIGTKQAASTPRTQKESSSTQKVRPTTPSKLAKKSFNSRLTPRKEQSFMTPRSETGSALNKALSSPWQIDTATPRRKSTLQGSGKQTMSLLHSKQFQPSTPSGQLATKPRKGVENIRRYSASPEGMLGRQKLSQTPRKQTTITETKRQPVTSLGKQPGLTPRQQSRASTLGKQTGMLPQKSCGADAAQEKEREIGKKKTFLKRNSLKGQLTASNERKIGATTERAKEASLQRVYGEPQSWKKAVTQSVDHVSVEPKPAPTKLPLPTLLANGCPNLAPSKIGISLKIAKEGSPAHHSQLRPAVVAPASRTPRNNTAASLSTMQVGPTARKQQVPDGQDCLVYPDAGVSRGSITQVEEASSCHAEQELPKYNECTASTVAGDTVNAPYHRAEQTCVEEEASLTEGNPITAAERQTDSEIPELQASQLYVQRKTLGCSGQRVSDPVSDEQMESSLPNRKGFLANAQNVQQTASPQSSPPRKQTGVTDSGNGLVRKEVNLLQRPGTVPGPADQKEFRLPLGRQTMTACPSPQKTIVEHQGTGIPRGQFVSRIAMSKMGSYAGKQVPTTSNRRVDCAVPNQQLGLPVGKQIEHTPGHSLLPTAVAPRRAVSTASRGQLTTTLRGHLDSTIPMSERALPSHGKLACRQSTPRNQSFSGPNTQLEEQSGEEIEQDVSNSLSLFQASAWPAMISATMNGSTVPKSVSAANFQRMQSRGSHYSPYADLRIGNGLMRGLPHATAVEREAEPHAQRLESTDIVGVANDTTDLPVRCSSTRMFDKGQPVDEQWLALTEDPQHLEEEDLGTNALGSTKCHVLYSEELCQSNALESWKVAQQAIDSSPLKSNVAEQLLREKSDSNIKRSSPSHGVYDPMIDNTPVDGDSLDDNESMEGCDPPMNSLQCSPEEVQFQAPEEPQSDHEDEMCDPEDCFANPGDCPDPKGSSVGVEESKGPSQETVEETSEETNSEVITERYNPWRALEKAKAQQTLEKGAQDATPQEDTLCACSEDDALSSLSLSSLVKDDCTSPGTANIAGFEAGNPFFGVPDLNSDDDVTVTGLVEGKSVVPVPADAWREDLFSPRKNPLFEKWANMRAKTGDEKHESDLPTRIDMALLRSSSSVVTRGGHAVEERRTNLTGWQKGVQPMAIWYKTNSEEPEDLDMDDSVAGSQVNLANKDDTCIPKNGEQQSWRSDPRKHGDRGLPQPALAETYSFEEWRQSGIVPLTQAPDSMVADTSFDRTPRSPSSLQGSQSQAKAAAPSAEEAAGFMFKPQTTDVNVNSGFSSWNSPVHSSCSVDSNEAACANDPDLWSRAPICGGASDGLTMQNDMPLIGPCVQDAAQAATGAGIPLGGPETQEGCLDVSVDSSDCGTLHSSVFEYTFDSVEEGGASSSTKRYQGLAPKVTQNSLQNLFYGCPSVDEPSHIPKPEITSTATAQEDMEKANDGEGKTSKGLDRDAAEMVINGRESPETLAIRPKQSSLSAISEEDETSISPSTPDARSNGKRIFGKSISSDSKDSGSLASQGFENDVGSDQEKTDSHMEGVGPTSPHWCDDETPGLGHGMFDSHVLSQPSGEGFRSLQDQYTSSLSGRTQHGPDDAPAGLGSQSLDDPKIQKVEKVRELEDVDSGSGDFFDGRGRVFPACGNIPQADDHISETAQSKADRGMKHHRRGLGFPKSPISPRHLSSSQRDLGSATSTPKSLPAPKQLMKEDSGSQHSGLPSVTLSSGSGRGLSLTNWDTALYPPGPVSEPEPHTPRIWNGNHESSATRSQAQSLTSLPFASKDEPARGPLRQDHGNMQVRQTGMRRSRCPPVRSVPALSMHSITLQDVQEDCPLEEEAPQARAASFTELAQSLGVNRELSRSASEIEENNGSASKHEGQSRDRFGAATDQPLHQKKSSRGNLVQKLKRKVSFSHSQKSVTPRREIGCFVFLSPRRRGGSWS